jgi:adenylate cyclase
MTDLIMASGGTIDKYMGDAIMAFWNAPLDDAAHAEHGCRCALAMRSTLVELNTTWAAEAAAAGQAHIPVNIGIGLNSGICCVGNVGSDQRFDYSVLGDDVNLASRLEGQSKTYHLDLVIGARTAAAVPMLATLELDSIMVKGKTEPVHVFTVVGDEAVAADPTFVSLKTEHDAMLVAFRSQDWAGAKRHLQNCRTYTPPLMVGFYDVYEERIAAYEASPPSPDWDGVYVALTK